MRRSRPRERHMDREREWVQYLYVYAWMNSMPVCACVSRVSRQCALRIAISSCHFQHACIIVSVSVRIVRTMARTLCSGSTSTCFKYIVLFCVCGYTEIYTYTYMYIAVLLYDRSHFSLSLPPHILHMKRTIPGNIFRATDFNREHDFRSSNATEFLTLCVPHIFDKLYRFSIHFCHMFVGVSMELRSSSIEEYSVRNYRWNNKIC